MLGRPFGDKAALGSPALYPCSYKWPCSPLACHASPEWQRELRCQSQNRERLWKILHRNKTGEVCWLLAVPWMRKLREGSRKAQGSIFCGVIRSKQTRWTWTGRGRKKHAGNYKEDKLELFNCVNSEDREGENKRCARLSLHKGWFKGKMLQLFAFSGLFHSAGSPWLTLTKVTHRDSHCPQLSFLGLC